MSVTFRRDDPVGLVAIVGDLLAANLERDPGRRRLLRDESSVLRAIDAGVGVTVRCTRRGVVVAAGADPGARVVVVASAARLLQLAAAPLRFGVPDALTPEGRAVLADILAGRVRVHGLLRRLPAVRRLTMLLSAR
ncbi:MAG TPA: hypothetical protein VLX89_04495 [Actinomycetota bacterium]|nr:hypothetical protein [Actinomycetota bacterium]